jgi:hypothetical protein
MAMIDPAIPMAVMNRATHRRSAAIATAWLSGFGCEDPAPTSDPHAPILLDRGLQLDFVRDLGSHRVVTHEGHGYAWQDALQMIQHELGQVFETFVSFPRNGDSRGLTTVLDEGIQSGVVVSCHSAAGTIWLIPESSVDDTTTWVYRSQRDRSFVEHAGDPGEADRTLRSAVLQTETRFDELGLIPRHESGRSFVLADAKAWESMQWPQFMSSARMLLANRAARLITSVEVALADDGGAFTGTQQSRRRTALDELDFAARRALEAALACTPSPAEY